MTNTETVPVADLEEMYAAEIPCGGIANRAMYTPPCGKAAVVKRVSHHNCPNLRERATSFKCLDCYTKLITFLTARFHQNGGSLTCPCGQTFNSMDNYARYAAI